MITQKYQNHNRKPLKYVISDTNKSDLGHEYLISIRFKLINSNIISIL